MSTPSMITLHARISVTEGGAFVRVGLFEEATLVTSFPVAVAHWPLLRAVLEHGCAAAGLNFAVEGPDPLFFR